ncbi:MAG: hypothetical protein K2W96_03320, partial [Gemmataceae bacterium]|nr:hypothetical protein [Gemmataceae bacterium]
MMTLAGDLDRVERHIDLFGSIVPTSPDVSGQARLQKHREEFDKEMAAGPQGTVEGGAEGWRRATAACGSGDGATACRDGVCQRRGGSAEG